MFRQFFNIFYHSDFLIRFDFDFTKSECFLIVVIINFQKFD